MIIASPAAGAPFGVQLVAVVQVPPAVWFHVLVAAKVDAPKANTKMPTRVMVALASDLVVEK